MTKHLLIITQKIDENDDLLGSFVDWVRALAPHIRRIDVIALGVGSYALPYNVHVYSLGKERGAFKIVQAFRLARLLWKHTPKAGAVFAHMSPLFAIVAWPVARLRASRLVLWYLHRSTTMRLRLALRLCDHLLTADERSLTIADPKIVSVGHGIAVDKWQVSRDWHMADRPLRVISVGRLSPIKDFGTLIRAVGFLREKGVRVHLRIVGRAVMEHDVAYEKELRALVRHLKLSDSIYFIGLVPHREMKTNYAWADAVVGCTPRGGLDKAVLEGMAAGCVAFTSNDIMHTTLGPYDDQLIFLHGDARALADALATFTDWSGASRVMVEQIKERHDLKKTVQRIAEFL